MRSGIQRFVTRPLITEKQSARNADNKDFAGVRQAFFRTRVRTCAHSFSPPKTKSKDFQIANPLNDSH
jgi:hypothetical protein